MLIKDGLIVTMDQSRRVIKGSVAIDGSEIREVGNVEDENAEKVIDAKGKIVMPGFVCAHTKPYRILLRAAPLKIESPSDFTQVLKRAWWPLDEELSSEEIYTSALFSGLEFIKTGTTFFAGISSSQGDIGKSLDQVASAVEDSGLRAFVGFEASERHTRAQGSRGMRENIRFLENRQKKKADETRVGGIVGLGPSFTTSDELLSHGKRVANRFGVPIVAPAGETRAELYHDLKEHGKRTIERYRDVGLLSPNTVLTDCIHVNRDELSIIRKAGAKVAHNPMDNMRNAVGVANVLEMGRMEISVGLGNGGYIFDGFENVRSLYLLHKAMEEDPRVISPMGALEMATVGAAKLYGIENKIGSIEPGKRADIIIIDFSRLPTPLRRDNAVTHIVNSIRGADVEATIVGGDILMQNRNIKTLDEKRVIEKSKKVAKDIWKKLDIIKR